MSFDLSYSMRCAHYTNYGPPSVLFVTRAPKPVPGPSDVLIRVVSSTASTGDWRVRSGKLPEGFGLIGSMFFRLAFGINGPRNPILGSECSGVVEAVGSAVTRFKPGDEVFAFPGSSLGCYAEYRCISESGPIAMKPTNLSFIDAAAICFGGVTMLDFYRRAAIQPGARVLVNGSSGCVGLAAVQLAKHYGCFVTATASARNSELVRSAGADQVIDYEATNISALAERWDVVVDTIGSLPFALAGPLIKDGGKFLAVLATLGDTIKAGWLSYCSGKTIVAGPSGESPEDVRMIGQLASQGVFRPHIDRVFTLEQIVEAHEYLDQGKKRGSIVISIQPNSCSQSITTDEKHATAHN